MLKKTLLASAILAVSSAAFAAPTVITVDGSGVKYATEQFGADASAVELASSAVALTFADGDSDTFAVEAGNIADITIELENGTFGANVALADFVTSATSGAWKITVLEGGQIGDNTVKFEVETLMAVPADEVLTLNIRTLTAPNFGTEAAKVTTKAQIVPTTTSGLNTFPTTVLVDNAVNFGVVAESASPWTITYAATTANASTSPVVADANGQIDVDARKVFIADSGDFFASNAAVAFAGTGIKLADGTTDVATANYSKVNTKIAGVMNAGDAVTSTNFGTFTVDTANNQATASVAAAAIVAEDLTYTPGGQVDMAPTSYVTTIEITPADSSWQTVSESTAKSTSYYGLTDGAHAMIIPNSSNADQAFLRVTNMNGSVNSVFVQVTAQDGSDLGLVELGDFAAGETQVVTAATLEGLLGQSWEGRARANFQSSGNINVMPLIRTNGVLTNQGSIQSNDGQYE